MFFADDLLGHLGSGASCKGGLLVELVVDIWLVCCGLECCLALFLVFATAWDITFFLILNSPRHHTFIHREISLTPNLLIATVSRLLPWQLLHTSLQFILLTLFRARFQLPLSMLKLARFTLILTFLHVLTWPWPILITRPLLPCKWRIVTQYSWRRQCLHRLQSNWWDTLD